MSFRFIFVASVFWVIGSEVATILASDAPQARLAQGSPRCRRGLRDGQRQAETTSEKPPGDLFGDRPGDLPGDLPGDRAGSLHWVDQKLF